MFWLISEALVIHRGGSGSPLTDDGNSVCVRSEAWIHTGGKGLGDVCACMYKGVRDEKSACAFVCEFCR